MLPFRIGLAHFRQSSSIDVLGRAVETGFMRDDDLLAWDREIDAHVVTVACLVMPLDQLDEDPAAHDSRVVRLELAQARQDLGFERVRTLDAAE
jgi:hypothetical protein